MASRHAGSRPVGARGGQRRAGRRQLPAAQQAIRRLDGARLARSGRGVVPRHRRGHEDVRRRRQQALSPVGLVLEQRVTHLGWSLCAGRRQSLALHAVRPACHRRQWRRRAAKVRPQRRHQLGGAEWLASHRYFHHDGPGLRADGQDRQHAAARAVVRPQQRRILGVVAHHTGRLPGPARWRQCHRPGRRRDRPDLPGDQRAAHVVRRRADRLSHRQDRQRHRRQRGRQRRRPARHGVLPAQVGLLHGAPARP